MHAVTRGCKILISIINKYTLRSVFLLVPYSLNCPCLFFAAFPMISESSGRLQVRIHSGKDTLKYGLTIENVEVIS